MDKTTNGGGMPMPTGELQGDSRAMPDRGTGTGLQPEGQNDCSVGGCDLGQSATNRMGGISGATQSDKGEA